MPDHLLPMSCKRRDIDIKFVHEELKRHENVLRIAIDQVDKFTLCFLRVLGCNGEFSRNFIDAWCETERIRASDAGVLIKDWFDTNLLMQFLEMGDITNLDEDKKSRAMQALQKLSQFIDNLKETNEFLQKLVPDLTESEWAAVFGTHVIKKLSIAKTMRISDSDYEEKSICPCGCREKLVYGDTSMGNTKVWHGSVDIIMGCSAIQIEEDLQPQIDDFNTSCNDVKIKEFDRRRQQLVSEAIVLSNIQPGAPLIVVSKTELKYFIYDLQSDILLESEEFDISEIELSTVLVLWMALNNTVFGLSPCYSELEQDFCSNFKTFMQQNHKLEIYESDLHFFGCKKSEYVLPKLQQIYAQVYRSGRTFDNKRADSPAP